MRSWLRRCVGYKMPATMGVKVKFHKGAWWIFINHHGRRARMIGDRDTANAVARRIRERLAPLVI